jgi:predicted DNA-binding mobile mystery protein A
MNIKQVVTIQYQQIVDRTANAVRDISVPSEGWLCTARKALNMSAAQLARRLSVSRAQVSQTEKRELTGSVTLNAIQQMAETMGYRFVYAIVPKDSVEDVIAARAKEKATDLVNQTNQHMALESQVLSKEQIQFEIKRIQRNLMDEMPSSLWNDE